MLLFFFVKGQPIGRKCRNGKIDSFQTIVSIHNFDQAMNWWLLLDKIKLVDVLTYDIY